MKGKFCTDLWYDEERYHNYAGDYQKPTGHFSQLVWRSSTEVGFGVATRGNYTVCVALYYTAGNVIGQFGWNVQRRLNAYKYSYPGLEAGAPLHLRHSSKKQQQRRHKKLTNKPLLNDLSLNKKAYIHSALNNKINPNNFKNKLNNKI